MSKQFVFKKEKESADSKDQFFLVDIYDDGQISLKVKEAGWSDTWSLSLDQTDGYGNVLLRQHFKKVS